MNKTTRRITIAFLAGWPLWLASVATAQDQPYTPTYTAPPVTPPPAAPANYTAEQIDQLTGPIALYPDPLLAQILPAATYPLDLTTAAQWLHTNPQPTEDAINAQPWEPSVKALLHYPTVLQMMVDQADWTQALGAAFANQPADVMASIQRLRQQAQTAGNLVNTPQQQVTTDNGAIAVVPTNPQTVYVPAYDPGLVYAPAVGTPLITFGVGFVVGGWLNCDFDWGHRRLNEGVRWDLGWRNREVGLPIRPWIRNPIKPIPPRVVIPPRRPIVVDPRRGWPDARPAPGAFRVEDRQAVDQALQRAHDSRPAFVAPPRPIPHPEPAPVPRPLPQPMPRPIEPAPRPMPQPAPRPMPAPAFHPAPNAAAQGARGHASMHH